MGWELGPNPVRFSPGEPHHPRPLSPTARQLRGSLPCVYLPMPHLPLDLFKCCSWHISLPELEKGALFLFLQPLEAGTGMNATPPHLRQSWQRSSQGRRVGHGRASSGSPGLPGTSRVAESGCGHYTRTSHLGESTPGGNLPTEERHQKPCSTINGRNIKGLLARVETSGTIYSRRGLSLGDEDVLDTRTYYLSLLILLPHPPAPPAWSSLSSSTEVGNTF